jgi:hypothetical protein
MAELLKNELKIEVKDDAVYSTRTIADKQSLADFIVVVQKTEDDLAFMQGAIEHFDEAVQQQKAHMKIDFAKRRKMHQFDKAWEQHYMGMLSQKRMWSERDIPSILSEIELLREARDKAAVLLSKQLKN